MVVVGNTSAVVARSPSHLCFTGPLHNLRADRTPIRALSDWREPRSVCTSMYCEATAIGSVETVMKWNALHGSRLHNHCKLRLAQSASDLVTSACWQPLRMYLVGTSCIVAIHELMSLELVRPTHLSEPTFLDLQRFHELAVVHDLKWHQCCFPLLDAVRLSLVIVSGLGASSWSS